MSSLDAITNKITKWVNSDYFAQFKAVKEKKYDPKNSLFS